MRRPGSRRRWISLGPAIVAALFIAAVLGTLWFTGLLDLSKLRPSRSASHAGMIAMPVSASAIPVYTRITRDHLWDPKNNRVAVIYLQPSQVTGDMLTGLGDIIGRILDHDKAAGYIFTRSDFFPVGTRAGLVAGIPAGKRAMRVDAEKVEGLFGLLPGDRFDLVATLAIDKGANTNLAAGSGVYGQQLNLQARMLNWQKQATVRVIVQNGVVVQPLTTRQVPITARTLTQGPVTRTKPVQEMVIAVNPNEVVHLTEALAVEAQVACVPRSGRPDDPLDSITPNLQPWVPVSGAIIADSTGAAGSSTVPASSAPITTIETIAGGKRDLVATPRQR